MIGVFDTGIGGLSILKALRRELPAQDFVYFADTGYAPYGEHGDAYVIDRSRAVARTLVEEHGAQALVVACNTATAAAVHVLRAGLSAAAHRRRGARAQAGGRAHAGPAASA